MESNCRKLVSACVQLGVQPSTVECLFSKDPDIKKGDFGEAPEGRKEASSSKLFGRPHPSANASMIPSQGDPLPGVGVQLTLPIGAQSGDLTLLP
ncbi:Pituitary homeobox 2, partial [Ophiophagus hannah]